MLLVLGAIVWRAWGGEDPRARGEREIAFYVDEAYPRWRAAMGGVCPPDLATLAPGHATHDPWGNELGMYCSTMMASQTPTLVIWSAGPDRKLGTPDDLDSQNTRTFVRELEWVARHGPDPR